MPKAPILSPWIAGIKNSFFCSGVPILLITGVAIPQVTNISITKPFMRHRIISSTKQTSNQ